MRKWYDRTEGETDIVEAAFGHPLHPGPWGELYSTPFTIAAPEELLPLRRMEEDGTRWFFPQAGHSEVGRLLESTGLSASLVAELTAPGVMEPHDGGMEIKPAGKTLLALPPGPRKKLYQALMQHPANRGQITFIHKDTLGDRFGGTHNGEHTMMLFKQLCCEHGDYLVFCGFSVVLAQLPTYEEKRDFMRGLTSQRTLTLKVRIKPGEDTSALAAYWGRGIRASDLRTLFQSIAATHSGGTLGIINLLPPQPSRRCFSTPCRTIRSTARAGARLPLDVFNFFNTETDEAYGDPALFMQKLRDDYTPAAGDPRYGDVALFTTPAGTVVHSAVYLADDIFYTKNGSTFTYPWMLETLPDCSSSTPFRWSPGEQLVVSYYRNKHL